MVDNPLVVRTGADRPRPWLQQGASSPLGYAAGIDRDAAANLVNGLDARLVSDIEEYYRQRDDVSFGSAQEAVDYFMEDRTWRNNNSVSVARDLYNNARSSDEQSTRLSRLQSVYEAFPDVWERGGRGWSGFGQNLVAMAADPINAISFGVGGAGARATATALARSGITEGVSRRALTAGIRRGAVAGFAENAATEAALDTGLQIRDQQLGIQDGFSVGRLALSAGAGGVLGAGLGGVFGAGGALAPSLRGPTRGQNAIQQGIADGETLRRADIANEAEAERLRIEADQAEADPVDPVEQSVTRISTLRDRFETMRSEAIESADTVSRDEAAELSAAASQLSRWPEHRDRLTAEIQQLTAETKSNQIDKAPERVAELEERITNGNNLFDQVDRLLAEDRFDEATQALIDAPAWRGPARDTPDAGEAQQTGQQGNQQTGQQTGQQAGNQQTQPRGGRAAPGNQGQNANANSSGTSSGPAPNQGSAPPPPDGPTQGPNATSAPQSPDPLAGQPGAGAGGTETPDLDLSRLTQQRQRLEVERRDAIAGGGFNPDGTVSQDTLDTVAGIEREIEEIDRQIDEIGQRVADDEAPPSDEGQAGGAPAADGASPPASSASAAPINMADAQNLFLVERKIDPEDVIAAFEAGGEKSIRTDNGAAEIVSVATGSPYGEALAFIKGHPSVKGRRTKKREDAVANLVQNTLIEARGMAEYGHVRSMMGSGATEMGLRLDVYDILVDSGLVGSRYRAGAKRAAREAVRYDANVYALHFMETNASPQDGSLAADMESAFGQEFSDIVMSALEGRDGGLDAQRMGKPVPRLPVAEMFWRMGLNEDDIAEFSRAVGIDIEKMRLEITKETRKRLSANRVRFNNEAVLELADEALFRELKNVAPLAHAQTQDPGLRGRIERNFFADSGEGRSIVGREGTVTNRGVTTSGPRFGKVQGSLSSGVPRDFHGKLFSRIVEQGRYGRQRLDAKASARRESDIAKIESKSNRLARDRYKESDNAYFLKPVDETIRLVDKEAKIYDGAMQALEALAEGASPNDILPPVIKKLPKGRRNSLRPDMEKGEAEAALANVAAEAKARAHQSATNLHNNLARQKKAPNFSFEEIGGQRAVDPTTGERLIRLDENAIASLSDADRAVVEELRLAQQRLEAVQSEIGDPDQIRSRVAELEKKTLSEEGLTNAQDRASASEGDESGLTKGQIAAAKRSITQHENATKAIAEEKAKLRKLSQARSILAEAQGSSARWRGQLAEVVIQDGISPTSTPAQIRAYLKGWSRTYRQSTQREVTGREVEADLMRDGEARARRMWAERSRLLQLFHNYRKKDDPQSRQAASALRIQLNQLTANINKADPEFIKNHRKEITAKKRERFEQLVREGKIEDPDGSFAAGRDEFYESIQRRMEEESDLYDLDPDAREEFLNEAEFNRAEEAVNQEADAVGAEEIQRAEISAAIDAFNHGNITAAQLQEMVAAITARFKEPVSGVKEPRGKPQSAAFKPFIVTTRDGYEVDVHNHFAYEAVAETARTPAHHLVSIGGAPVSQIFKTNEGVRLRYRNASGDLVDAGYPNANAAKRDFTTIFERQIADAIQANPRQFKKAAAAPGTPPHRVPSDASKTYVDQGRTEEAAPPRKPVSAAGNDLDVAANTIMTPPGTKLVVQIQSGSLMGIVREPKGGQTIGQVLGKQNKSKYILGTVPEGTVVSTKPADQFKAQASITPLREGEPPIRPNGKPPAGSAARKIGGRDASKRPIALDALASVKIDEADLPKALQGLGIDTLDKLHTRSIQLENQPWRNITSKQRYQDLISALSQTYAGLSKFAPKGIQYPVANRTKALRSIEAIYRGAPDEDIAAINSILNRLVSNKNVAPVLEADSEGSRFMMPMARNAERANQVRLQTRDSKSPYPNFVAFAHEIGHWAYMNVLDPSDRLTFWNAMGKYVGQEGVDEIALAARLPGVVDNENASPAEFFANQFSQWVVSRGKTTTMDSTIWTRLARKVKAVIDRFIMGPANPARDDLVDPDLLPLFERILPDQPAENRFMPILADTAATEAQQGIAKVLVNIENRRMGLRRALGGQSAEDGFSDLSPTELQDAVKAAKNYLFAATGAGTSKRFMLKTLFSPDRIGRNRYYGLLKRNAMRAQQRAHTFLSEQGAFDGATKRREPDSGAMDPELARLIAEQEREMAADQAGMLSEFGEEVSGDAYGSTYDAAVAQIMQRETPETAHLEAIALDLDVTLYGMQKALAEAWSRAGARLPDGSRRVVTPEANIEIVKPNPRSSRFKRAYNKRVQSVVDNIDSIMDRVVEDARTNIGEQRMGEVAPSAGGGSPKAMSMRQLMAERAETKSAARRQDLAHEIVNRRNQMAEDGVEQQPLRDNKARAAERTEVEQTAGVDPDSGIPAHAPAAIREALRAITYRDPRVEYSARTMAYRMLNMMGRTQKRALNDVSFATVEDLYKLAGERPPENVPGITIETGLVTGPLGNRFRNAYRRFAVGVSQQKDAPATLMHEIGHVLVRSTATEAEMRAISRGYREALAAGDEIATQFADKLYADAPEERRAVEWFVEGWSKYMQEREALASRGPVAAVMDAIAERAAYLLNGLVGNKGIRQTYRRLAMFRPVGEEAAEKRPLANAVAATGIHAVDFQLAPSYAREVVSTLDPVRRAAVRDFVGATAEENLGDFVMFHGTPNGQAFSQTADPDVALHPSSAGVFGPGIYVTKAKDLGEKYSRGYSQGAMERLFADAAKKRGVSRPDAMRYMADVMAAQNEVARVVDEMEGIRYSNASRRAAEEMSPDELDMLAPEAPARRLADLRRRLDNATAKEAAAWRLAKDELGVESTPKVLPLYVRAMAPFDFRESVTYTASGAPDATDIRWLFDEMEADGIITNADEAIAELDEAFTGLDLYEALTGDISTPGIMARFEGPAGRYGPHEDLSEFLRRQGFDSLHVSEVGFDDQGTLVDSMVLFDSEQVKHVEASMFDAESPALFQRRADKTPRPAGALFQRISETGETFDPREFGSIIADYQEMGVPKAAVGFMRKVARKEAPTDEDTRNVVGTFTRLFRENAERFRRYGANWFADKIKPRHGTGFYERMESNLSRRMQPIQKALMELPGTKGVLKNYIRRSRQMIPGRLGDGQVPEAWRRIGDAILLGPSGMARLYDPEERRIARLIDETLGRERQDLIDLGVMVGDGRVRGGGGYLPIVWSPDLIKADPQAFMEQFSAFFVRESMRDPQMQAMTRAEANEKARALFDKIVERNGVNDMAVADLHSFLGSHLSAKVIRMSVEDVPGLSRFQDRDLVSLLGRYFDQTSRRKALTEDWGVGLHGFDAYKSVAVNGARAVTQILMSAKNITYNARAYNERVKVEDQLIPPLTKDPKRAEMLTQQVVAALGATPSSRRANKAKAISILMSAQEPAARTPAYKKRVESLVNGLVDFGHEGGLTVSAANEMDQMMNLLHRRPVDGGDASGPLYTLSRRARAFSSVTLLGWTTLASIPDIAMPLIRSGNAAAFVKGWQKWMAADGAYKDAVRNIGVSIENLINDRMTDSALNGGYSQRLMNAFFTATGLQGWTNMNREISGLIGIEALKTEAKRAQRLLNEGKQDTTAFKTSQRFLERYGLAGPEAPVDYTNPGAPRLDDINQWANNDQLRYAVMRFVNEAVFTPNPNDIPIWGNTPWGAMIFQLKSFPLMMQRMAGYILDEAKHKNFKPMAAFATVGAGLGMTSLLVRDYAQARGGEDEQSFGRRHRSLSNIAEEFGFDLDIDNETADQLAGWYLEGLLALGGFGLFADLLYNTSAQLDNGAYGRERIMGAVFGPTAGALFQGLGALQGVPQLVTDSDTNGQARNTVRQVAGRIPVLGGIRQFREAAADAIGGEVED